MKILILIDSLDIGGAETHVEVLSSELDNMGHIITVASSGGIISERLKNQGINHISLPQILKSSKNTYGLRSISHFFALERAILRAIEQEEPDIVHAHTRLTAFFAHKICRVRKIPLIFTAHAKFNMTFPKNALSKWGDHTISVSDDIKKHLTEHGLAPSKITIIENGVKLPDTVPQSLEQSSESAPKKKKIVFVSRLDSDCSLGAYVLCAIAERLSEKYNDLQIIIVGGGEEFKKIEQKAKIINAKYNRELICVVGRVENPSCFFDLGTVFVGVSRAALEAMAHGLPVILLGNEGYLGLLTKKDLDIAKETNFTCRDNDLYDFSLLKTMLFEEICRYFDLSESDKYQISEFSFNVIKNGYTAQNMAQKTLKVYERELRSKAKATKKLTSKRPKIAICGYYGHGNLGDEAILSVIRESIEKNSPNAEIHVIGSKNPIKNARALLGADLFIFGGGSLLQNTTSNASLLYYLAIISIANLTCKRKIMLSNGIGPIEDGILSRKISLKTIAGILEKLDFISVRDILSQKLLSEILPERNIKLLPDPAVVFAHNINCELIASSKQEYLIYIPCAGGLKRSKISLDPLANSLTRAQQSINAPLMIVVLNKKEDLSVAKEVALQIPNIKLLCPSTPDQLISVLRQARSVISQRYHGTLFSTICQIPTLAISDDPKMHALCTDLSLFPCQNSRTLGAPEELNKLLFKLENFYNEKPINLYEIEKKANDFEVEFKKILNNFDLLY